MPAPSRPVFALPANPPTPTSRRPISPSLCAIIGIAATGLIVAACTASPTPPGLLALAAAAGLAFTAAATALAARAGARYDLRRRLVDALLPILASKGDGGLHGNIRLHRWTGGWPGTPSRIDLHYGGRVDGTDPTWVAQVVAMVEGRLLASYTVRSHNPRRGRLALRLDAELDNSDPTTQRVTKRTKRAVADLLGASATVNNIHMTDDGCLQSFDVAHQAGSKLAANGGYRARVERTISAMNPGRWRAAWDLENDTAHFEQRPVLPKSVWLPLTSPVAGDDLLANYRQVKIPFAVDEDLQVLSWYPAVVPQLMITGGTGSGKTSTVHGILGQITRNGWPVWVVDPKRVEFLPFRSWPNVQIVATTLEQQVALIHKAWTVMEDRYQLIEEGRATAADFEPLVVILDEFAEFRLNLLEWYARIKVKGDPTKPLTLTHQVPSLARKARTARIHLIMATQRPDVDLLGSGEMRDNFGQRISMGRLSPAGAGMMWDDHTVGVSLPRRLTGRAMAMNADEVPTEVQTYRFPDHHSDDPFQVDLLEQLRPTETRWPRLVVVPPNLGHDLDTSEPVQPTFTDYLHADWDFAANRPDLDPVEIAKKSDPAAGRAMSSPMASLGLAGQSRPSRQAMIAIRPAAGTHEPDGPVDVDELNDHDYEPPAARSPRQLTVGDLLEVDEGSGVWVVVDAEPEDDPFDTGEVLISWRGDDDDWGSVSFPADAMVEARSPREHEGALNHV